MTVLAENHTPLRLLSVIGGIALATCLVFMIQLLSAVQTSHSENNTMLVFNLIDLPDTKVTTKTHRKPRKKPVKKIKKTLPVKSQTQEISKAEPVAKNTAPDLSNRSTQPIINTDSDTSEDSLPSPMPFFKLSDLPRFMHREVPVYPENMRANGKTGIVELSVLIDKAGKVREITILKSAGEYFDKAAIDAIKASSFMPAKVDGKPVTSLLKMPVKFKLL